MGGSSVRQGPAVGGGSCVCWGEVQLRGSAGDYRRGRMSDAGLALEGKVRKKMRGGRGGGGGGGGVPPF